MKLSVAESKFWEDYLGSLPVSQHPLNPFVDASFAGSKEMTDKLLKLYISGKKTAASGLMEDYLSSGDPLPKVGNFWIVLDSKKEPRLILRTEKIVLQKFKDVSFETACAEGEGDGSLEYWKTAHERFFKPFLHQWGISNLDETTVITEHFKLVYSKDPTDCP